MAGGTQHKYNFHDTWLIKGDAEKVWQAIIHPETWNSWWPGFKECELLDSPSGVVCRFSIQSLFPVSIEFYTHTTNYEKLKFIEVKCWGDLTGHGRWEFELKDKGVELRHNWEVTTQPLWMKAGNFLGRPLFKKSHDHLMKEGEKGLQGLVGR